MMMTMMMLRSIQVGPIGQKRAKRLKRADAERQRGAAVLTTLTDAVSSLATSKLEKSKARAAVNDAAARAL
jgi:hypothetical protein